METSFEAYIKDFLYKKYGEVANQLFSLSYILQYIVNKTKSADKGAKSRGSFANLYAIYVLVEDYLNKGFDKSGDYSKYEGAMFSTLLKRQRELPFGSKLQNHALNSRMNEEFFKFFPTQKGIQPILRDSETTRYWFNENYLKIQIGKSSYNIAQDIINIINHYVEVKQGSFKQFIEQCKKLQNIHIGNKTEVNDFVLSLLAANVNARLFEIVSYSILKYYFKDQIIYWGFTPEVEKLTKDHLHLYKTGRTNANDGGIDFVMKPLGRFFQVTETLDFKKYFLDIEKIERYPLTFVIKSEESIDDLKAKLRNDALKTYVVQKIVEDYMLCIEEIINIPLLKQYLIELNNKNLLSEVLKEIIIQSKVEFNYEDEE
ncbi:MAG: restriction endonuclease [Bacteroidales bacterium]|nr:restriction endonuclease [Bacteroidales bacterium]